MKTNGITLQYGQRLDACYLKFHASYRVHRSAHSQRILSVHSIPAASTSPVCTKEEDRKTESFLVSNIAVFP